MNRAADARVYGDLTCTSLCPTAALIRKLWIGETDAYRDHLLRLDRDSRYRRFSGAVSDEFIARHAATANGTRRRGARILRRRRAARRRRIAAHGPALARQAEAAFSIEQPWQSHGVGTELLERTLLTARNRGIKSLRMDCLAENRRMQQLARKFDAELSFDFGSVVGEVDPPRSTLLSLMREADGRQLRRRRRDFEVQSRLLRPA